MPASNHAEVLAHPKEGTPIVTHDRHVVTPTISLERLLTVEEAGEVLGTKGPRFPRRLIAERRIRFVRVGRHVRIPESALAEYIAARTVEPIVDRRRGRRAA